MLEGVASGLRLLRFAPFLNIYPPLTVALLLLRAGVGAYQCAAAVAIAGNRPVGPALGRIALVVSGVLAVGEIGFGLVPTSIFSAFRWPAVLVYEVYAAAGVWYLTARRTDAAAISPGTGID